MQILFSHLNSGLFCLFRLSHDFFSAPASSSISMSFIIFWQFQGGYFTSIIHLSLLLSSVSRSFLSAPRSFFLLLSSLFLSSLLFLFFLSSCRYLVRQPPPCRTVSDGPACMFVCEIFIEGLKLLQWPALLSKQALSSGMDKVQERGALLPGNDREYWGNRHTGIWRKKKREEEESEEEEKKKRKKEKKKR